MSNPIFVPFNTFLGQPQDLNRAGTEGLKLLLLKLSSSRIYSLLLPAPKPTGASLPGAKLSECRDPPALSFAILPQCIDLCLREGMLSEDRGHGSVLI